MAQDWRTLKLEVLAETGQFLKGMNQANAKTESFGDKLKDFGKKAAIAFGAAAAAAGAYATKLVIDGVKAAVEDEAAQSRLANALRNVTGATNQQIAAVEKQITALSTSLGIADDELRPAFQRLAVATGDLGEANKGLALALDISAATGKSVEQVANALGKAYEGNVGALGRLGIGLSTAEIKALGLDGTMNKLSETFAGAASERTKTFQGQMELLTVRFNEAKETIGFAFLPIITEMLNVFNEKVTPALEKLANGFGGEEGLLVRIQDTAAGIVDPFIPVLEALKDAFDKIYKAVKDNESNFRDFYEFMSTLFTFFNKYFVPILQNQVVSAIQGIATAFNFVLKAVIPIIGTLTDLINGLISTIDRALSKLQSLSGASGILGFLSNPLGTLGNNLFRRTSDIVNSNFNNVPNNVTTGVTINVNSPSIIDETGFTRAVVDAFNSVERRSAGGLSALTV